MLRRKWIRSLATYSNAAIHFLGANGRPVPLLVLPERGRDRTVGHVITKTKSLRRNVAMRDRDLIPCGPIGALVRKRVLEVTIVETGNIHAGQKISSDAHSR